MRLGLERLLDKPDALPGERWGLVTNVTGVTANLIPSAAAVRERVGDRLAVLVGPEHGLFGTAQAGETESCDHDPVTGLPVLQSYGLSMSELDERLAAASVDCLVIDLQDIGVRYYTYVWTAVDILRSAGRLGIPVVVCDRPNPLGGKVSGPGLLPDFESFVGRLDVPIQHGMTLGEILRETRERDATEGVPVADLVVVAMEGWRREAGWPEAELMWVPPSPNLPTLDALRLYSGTCLFEGTNMSEGRGTTLPFQVMGAPWFPLSLVDDLNSLSLPGVRFRGVRFVPTFSKYAGQEISGCQIHIVDKDALKPIELAVSVLEVVSASCSEFAWEPVTDKPFVDRLWGSDTLRRRLAGESVAVPKARSLVADLLYE